MSTYSVKVFNGKPPTENYRNFILSKWLRSFRFGNEFIRLTRSSSYYPKYGDYIKSILDSPLVSTRLAVLSDEPDVALGFSVVSGETLHYVYVGVDYRLQGIGRRLIPIEIKEFTHITKKWMLIWATKFPNSEFDPFQ